MSSGTPGPRSREVVAQQVPRTRLAGFPAYRLDPRTVLCRAHLAANGPWWFSHDGGGRFDLPAPRGTCYLATDPAAAVRERLGAVLGGVPYVPV
ncbi:MAG: RES domain-containing protein, partial [Oryzihumus sp.]